MFLGFTRLLFYKCLWFIIVPLDVSFFVCVNGLNIWLLNVLVMRCGVVSFGSLELNREEENAFRLYARASDMLKINLYQSNLTTRSF